MVIAALSYCLIVLIILPHLFDLNSHKPRIETKAAEALGMKVQIGGNIGFALLPHLRIFIENINIQSKEADETIILFFISYKLYVG